MPSQLEIRGRTGLKQFGGVIDEELHRRLRGPAKIQTYREMSENDPVIGACLRLPQLLLRQCSWDIEPASEEQEDLDNAQFLRECLDDISPNWQDTLSEILSMLTYGWSFLEQCYKRRNGYSRDPHKSSKYADGRIGWLRFGIRCQESLYRWEFDDEGQLLGMWQMPAPSYKLLYVPLEKALLFRTESKKNSPEGVSLLRNCFVPWYRKKRVEEFEGIGVERDLAGLPVMQVPSEILDPNASAAEKSLLADLQKYVAEIKRDEREGMVIPAEEKTGPQGQTVKTGYKFSLVSTGGARQFDTNGIINRYDGRIAMTFLADFLLLGHEKVGSFSLSSDKTDLYAISLGSIRDSVAAEFNADAVPALFRLNGIQAEKLPKLKPGDIETPPLAEIADSLNKLVGAAVLNPDKSIERYVRQLWKLPEAEDETV